MPDSDSIEILSADPSLLAINKPPGLLTLPDGYQPELPHVRALLEPQHGPLWIVHRLDKDTSGVLLLARTPEMHRALSMLFEKRQMHKTYHALVRGVPSWETNHFDAPLRSGVGRRKRTVVDPRRGKPALTNFRVLQRFPGFALVAARPQTGRTHQIRAHLYALGHAIVGDPLYGSLDDDPDLPFQRTALHARQLTFTHPQSGRVVEIPAGYPADFSAVLARGSQEWPLDALSSDR